MLFDHDANFLKNTHDVCNGVWMFTSCDHAKNVAKCVNVKMEKCISHENVDFRAENILSYNVQQVFRSAWGRPGRLRGIHASTFDI